MKKIELRENGTRRVYIVNDQPTKTDQSQAPACDVNNIMAQYKKTGQITHLAKVKGVFADLSAISDLHASMNEVTLAQQAFDALPAELRFRFQNSPLEMLNFLNNPKNDQEAIALGLKIPRQKDEIPSPQVATSPSMSSSQKNKNTKNHPAKNDDDLNDDE